MPIASNDKVSTICLLHFEIQKLNYKMANLYFQLYIKTKCYCEMKTIENKQNKSYVC